MNLQRLPEYAVRWVATLVGILIAIYLGKSAGNGQTSLIVGFLLAVSGIALVLTVREKIWVAVPVAWALSGQIPSLALPFSVRDLVILFVLGAFLPLKAFKILRRKALFGNLEIICGTMAIYLIISFLRNPVGVDALDSDRVGGRPYFNCLVGILAYWILSQVSLHSKNADRLAIVITAGRMMEGIMAQFLSWFPVLLSLSAAYYTCGYFTWVSNGSDFMTPGAESTSRLGYLAAIGQPLLTYLFASRSLNKLLNPFQFWQPLLLGIGVLCVLFSGFRSVLFACLGALFIINYINNKWKGIIGISASFCFILLIIITGNGRIFNLPLSTQRALSWLPGEWDQTAVLEARNSTSWRTFMWKEMLTTDRYIQNKLLGDGFGFTKRQYETMQYFSKYGSGAEGQENFMISGNVHSGPVGSIRYGGYVGLCLLLLILVMQAREAWRIIHISYHTPFRTLTLFVCVPIVFEPVFFTLIFGAYDNAIPDVFYNLGMLRMLHNSIGDQQASKNRKVDSVTDFLQTQSPQHPHTHAGIPIA